MSGGLFATISRVVAGVGLTRAVRVDSPLPRRPRAAAHLASAGLLILLALLWPTQAMAQTNPAVVVEYYHLDALGSVRVVTDQNGQILKNAAGVEVGRHDFLPFGEEWPAPQPTAKEKKLFTGHERDTDTGLDYFGARYYRPQVGRFTTIDPLQTTAENLTDPQRWNRYAYVRNNPLKYTDPDGRMPWALIVPAFVGTVVYGGWDIWTNVQRGDPWNQNLGVEMSKGFIVGLTLGSMAPAVVGSGVGYGSLEVIAAGGRVAFANEHLLQEHFAKHGAEFGAPTAGQYLERASLFVEAAARGARGVDTAIRANGDTLLYNRATQRISSLL
jgi:RHS repeat-associated protein